MAYKIKYGAGGVPYVSKKQSNVLSEILTENPNVEDVSVEIDDDTVDEVVTKKTKKKVIKNEKF
jgi:hypothetical protein